MVVLIRRGSEIDGFTLLIVAGGDPLFVVGAMDFDLPLCSAIS
jgi:hypothetical protein